MELHFRAYLDGLEGAVVDEAEVFAGGEECGGHVTLEGLHQDAVLLELAVGIGRVEGDDGRDPVGVASALEGVALDEFGVVGGNFTAEEPEVVEEGEGNG